MSKVAISGGENMGDWGKLFRLPPELPKFATLDKNHSKRFSYFRVVFYAVLHRPGLATYFELPVRLLSSIRLKTTMPPTAKLIKYNTTINKIATINGLPG